MGVSDTLTDLTKSVADLYKELVTNTVRFEELRRHATETLDDFKRALEVLGHKIEVIQAEHVKHQAQMAASIQILEGRLDSLSEKALHAVVREAAREVALEQFQEERSSANIAALDWGKEDVVEANLRDCGAVAKERLTRLLHRTACAAGEEQCRYCDPRSLHELFSSPFDENHPYHRVNLGA